MVEIDEQTGFQESNFWEEIKINTNLLVYGKDGELIRSYNLPVGAHLMVEDEKN
jgi:DNA-directed RNA polymerase subunit beta'